MNSEIFYLFLRKYMFSIFCPLKWPKTQLPETPFMPRLHSLNTISPLIGTRVLGRKVILVEGRNVQDKSGTSCHTRSKEAIIEYGGCIKRIKEQT